MQSLHGFSCAPGVLYHKRLPSERLSIPWRGSGSSAHLYQPQCQGPTKNVVWTGRTPHLFLNVRLRKIHVSVVFIGKILFHIEIIRLAFLPLILLPNTYYTVTHFKSNFTASRTFFINDWPLEPMWPGNFGKVKTSTILWSKFAVWTSFKEAKGKRAYFFIFPAMTGWLQRGTWLKNQQWGNVCWSSLETKLKSAGITSTSHFLKTTILSKVTGESHHWWSYLRPVLYFRDSKCTLETVLQQVKSGSQVINTITKI